MLMKAVKLSVLSVGALGLTGGLIFGRDLASYVSSSAHSIRASVKDNVPVEFELGRARDLLDDIIPEMHANVRLIAQQEVEIDNLRRDIDAGAKACTEQTAQVQKLRDALATKNDSFSFQQINYTRDQVKDDLAMRLENVKEARLVLATRQRLLDNRGKALAAAMQALNRTRSQKSLLESQIAALEGQNRLLQATSVGTCSQIDNSKLAQTEKLIAQIKKQLDVAERVLAHESKFTQPIVVETVTEKELVTQADEYLASAKK
jgi:flagellar biosynthesis chaperone FliJ